MPGVSVISFSGWVPPGCPKREISLKACTKSKLSDLKKNLVRQVL